MLSSIPRPPAFINSGANRASAAAWRRGANRASAADLSAGFFLFGLRNLFLVLLQPFKQGSVCGSRLAAFLCDVQKLRRAFLEVPFNRR
jgi:hypothetical protein